MRHNEKTSLLTNWPQWKICRRSEVAGGNGRRQSRGNLDAGSKLHIDIETE
jgi:hypothetical protein